MKNVRAVFIAYLVIIVLGIVSSLGIHFRPTNLFDTLLMLTLLAAGIGLVARSLRAQGPEASDTR